MLGSAGAGVDDGLNLEDIGSLGRIVPHRPAANGKSAGSGSLDTHGAHRHSVSLVVVVDDEQRADAHFVEPGCDCTRTRRVVRHEPDECRAA